MMSGIRRCLNYQAHPCSDTPRLGMDICEKPSSVHAAVADWRPLQDLWSTLASFWIVVGLLRLSSIDEGFSLLAALCMGTSFKCFLPYWWYNNHTTKMQSMAVMCKLLILNLRAVVDALGSFFPSGFLYVFLFPMRNWECVSCVVP